MKEFDSIRIVDKGGDSLSFEMTLQEAHTTRSCFCFGQLPA